MSPHGLNDCITVHTRIETGTERHNKRCLATCRVELLLRQDAHRREPTSESGRKGSSGATITATDRACVASIAESAESTRTPSIPSMLMTPSGDGRRVRDGAAHRQRTFKFEDDNRETNPAESPDDTGAEVAATADDDEMTRRVDH